MFFRKIFCLLFCACYLLTAADDIRKKGDMVSEAKVLILKETTAEADSQNIRTQALEQVKQWQQTLEGLPEYTVRPVVDAKKTKATDILVWSTKWPKSRLQTHVNRFIELLQEAEFLDDGSKPSEEYCKQHKVIADELYHSSWTTDEDEYGRHEHFPYDWFFNKQDKSLTKYKLDSKKAEDLYQAFSIFTWSKFLVELIEAEQYRCQIDKSRWDRFSGNNAAALRSKLAFLRMHNKHEQYPQLFSDWINCFSTDTDLTEITSKRYALEKILINTMKIYFATAAIVVPICAYFVYEEISKNGIKWSFGGQENKALTDVSSAEDVSVDGGLVAAQTHHRFMQELSEPTSLILMAQYLLGNASRQFLNLIRTPNGDCGATIAAAHNATWPVIRANLQPMNTLCSFALNQDTGSFDGGCGEYDGEVPCEDDEKRMVGEPSCMASNKKLASGSMQLMFSRNCLSIDYKFLPPTATKEPTATKVIRRFGTNTNSKTLTLSPSSMNSRTITYTSLDSFSVSVPSPSLHMTRSGTGTGIFSGSFSGNRSSSASGSLSGLWSLTLSDSDSDSGSLSDSEEFSASNSLGQWMAQIPDDQIPQEFWRWDELIPNGAPGSPAARHAHVTGMVGDELFVGYGRDSSGGYLQDGYYFNFSSQSWKIADTLPYNTAYSQSWTNGRETFVQGGTPVGIPGIAKFTQNSTTILSGSGNGGLPSNWLCGATTMINDIFYVFGGGNNGIVNSNTLWSYNTSSNFSNWQSFTPTIAPSPRYQVRMINIDKTIYLFGGRLQSGSSTYYNDMWKYSLQNSNWMQPTTSGNNIPAARFSYAMNNIEDIIFLFGGAQYPSSIWNSLNDLWKFDAKNNLWTQLMIDGNNNGPSARCESNMINYLNNFYLFGGTDYSSRTTNDLWRFHYQTMGINNISISNNPVLFGQPFNFSWAVDTEYGSPEHVASVIFEGQNYTATYPNSKGSMLLNISRRFGNSSLQLFVHDPKYPYVKVNQTVNFTQLSR